MTTQSSSSAWSHLNRIISRSSQRKVQDEQETNPIALTLGKSSNLLVRLINETFLSLPILKCQNFTFPKENESELEATLIDDEQSFVYDICFVDWNGAKIVKNLFLDNEKWKTPEDHEQRDFTLTNLTDLAHSDRGNSLRLKNAFQNISSSTTPNKHLTFEAITPSRVARNSFVNDTTSFIGTSYLSFSSFLSLCGVVINLFIILIIIFNTRQNRRSIIRNSNLGKNNLLLLQLTMTGLILSSYVFLDNMNNFDRSIFYHQEFFQKIHNFFHGGFEDETGNLAIYSTLDNPAIPLLTFLPPTPFHWKQHDLHKSECKFGSSENSFDYLSPSSSYSFNNEEVELIQDDKQKVNMAGGARTALVMKFYENDSFSSSNKTKTIKQNTWYLAKSGSQIIDSSSAIDLSDQSLASVFVAETSCQEVSPSKRIKREKKESLTPKIDTVDSSSKSQHDQSSSCSYSRYTKFMISSILPLMIDVVASLHVWTVVALAYDRYRAIAHPLQYLRHIHASRSRIFFILSWTISLSFSLFAPILSSHLLERMYINQSNLSAEPTVKQTSLRYQKYTWNINQSEDTEINQKCRISTHTLTNHLSFFEEFAALNQTDRIRLNYIQRNSNSTVHKKESKQPVSDLGLEKKFLELPFNFDSFGNSLNHHIASEKRNEINVINKKLPALILLAHSFLGLIFIILIPLITITFCNIKIYKIVKVHERRLSFGSGSNVGGSANNVHNYAKRQQQQQQPKKNPQECESFSMSSILEKLVSFSFLREINQQASPSTSCLDININQQDCVIEDPFRAGSKLTEHSSINNNNNSNASIINRSKRMPINRQDSYQILANLMHEKNQQTQAIVEGSTTAGQQYDNQKSQSCQSTIFSPIRHAKHQHLMKRKTSDHEVAYLLRDENRKGSTSSGHPTYGDIGEHFNSSAPDCHSCADSPSYSVADYSKCYTSGGILNQLKMAGLSFAGVSIQDPLSTLHSTRKTLHRSSSCSLTNLHSNGTNHKLPQSFRPNSKLNQFRQLQHNPKQSSFCNQSHRRDNSASTCMETASLSEMCQRKICVSLDSNQFFEDSSSNNNKFITKLLDEETDSMQQQSSNHLHLNNQPHRFPFFIGTKSASFNIIIWLIITMLVFIIPHYIIITITQLFKLNSTSNSSQQLSEFDKPDLDAYKEKLVEFYNYIFKSNLNDSGLQSNNAWGTIEDNQLLVRVSFRWLPCICRILYLCMIPLNGCLYGISSRSLRATLRMILKRYISRRQASIEINHRQKSISSMRSRESSIINIPPVYYSHNMDLCLRLNNHYNNYEKQEKIFKRCNSFADNRGLDNISNNKKQEFLSRRFSDYSITSKESNLKSFHNKSFQTSSNDQNITFMIGNSNFKRESTATSTATARKSVHNNVFDDNQLASPTISLGESTRSLVSTTISSANSLNNAPLDEKRNELIKKLDLISKSKQIIPQRRTSEIQAPNNNQLQHRKPMLGSEHLDLAISSARHTMTDRDRNRTELERMEDLSKKHLDFVEENSGELSLSPNKPTRVSNDLSEFKFFVTTANQKQHQHIINVNLPLDANSSTFRNSINPSTRTLSAHKDSNNIGDTNNSGPGKSSETLWKQVKQNLGKILLTASAQLLSIKLSEDGNYCNTLKQSSNRLSSTLRSSDATFNENTYENDPSRVALLRRNSIDCFSTLSRHQSSSKKYQSPTKKCNYKHNFASSCNQNKLNSQQDPKICIHQLRSSVSNNSINDNKLSIVKNSKNNGQPQGCKYANLGSSTPALANQSIAYLKPPNFLKLTQFDLNEQPNNYQITSALSPIKECSTTHSYASSQSSLNNVNQQQQQQQQTLQVQPMFNPQALSDSVSTTIAIESERKILNDEVFY